MATSFSSTIRTSLKPGQQPKAQSLEPSSLWPRLRRQLHFEGLAETDGLAVLRRRMESPGTNGVDELVVELRVNAFLDGDVRHLAFLVHDDLENPHLIVAQDRE